MAKKLCDNCKKDIPKKPPSERVLFVKKEASKRGLTYMEANSNPSVKKAWDELKKK
jgi:hypothetical protein